MKPDMSRFPAPAEHKPSKDAEPPEEYEPEQSLVLLPCAPGLCIECAVDHPKEYPHNQQSLYWQYYFFSKHQRWPTWEDAMAHCDLEMKTFWVKQLTERGIKVELR